MNSLFCNNPDLSFGFSTSYPPFNNEDIHIHDKCELYYFISGSGYYETEGTRYEFTPGMILLMRPGEAHRSVCFDDAPYTRMSIHFHPSVVDSIDSSRRILRAFYQRKMGSRNYYNREMLEHTNIYQHLEKMTIPCGNSDAQCVQILSYLLPVLIELSEVYDRCADQSANSSSPVIHNILDYINRNLSSPLSVDVLCEKFFITRAQLYPLFKSATKMNVWEYIVLKRLVLARSLINDGTSVVEAAKACGFKDYSSFYRAYTAKYGESPSGVSRKK